MPVNSTAVWPMTEAGGFKYQVNDGYGGRGVQGRLKVLFLVAVIAL